MGDRDDVALVDIYDYLMKVCGIVQLAPVDVDSNLRRS